MGIQDILGAAASNVASAQLVAAQLEDDNRRLQVNLHEQEMVLVQQEQQIASQAVRIAELEAQLNGGGGGEEPPPPVRPMLVGASVQQRAGESWSQALARFETSVSTSAGRPFKCQVVRRFVGPTVVPSMQASAFRGLAGYSTILSFKHNSTVDQIAAWLRDLHSGPGIRHHVASWHEPENDLTGPEFWARQQRLLDAVDRVGRTDIQPTIIVMGWWERDNRVETTSATFMPPRDMIGRFVLGLDVYDRHQNIELETLCTPTLALWRALGGDRWMLGEVATKRKGLAAKEWIERSGAWARANGCEAFPWFDSDEGDDQGVPLGEGFYLDLRGPTAEAAFAALID